MYCTYLLRNHDLNIHTTTAHFFFLLGSVLVRVAEEGQEELNKVFLNRVAPTTSRIFSAWGRSTIHVHRSTLHCQSIFFFHDILASEADGALKKLGKLSTTSYISPTRLSFSIRFLPALCDYLYRQFAICR